MENATKRIGMASGSTHWEKAGMTQEEWKKVVKKLGILLGDYLLHHDYYGSHDVLYGYHE